MAKRKVSNYDGELNKNLRLLLALVASLGILSAFIYGTHDWTNQTQPQSQQPASVQQSSETDQKTINCAQKLDQDEIAMGTQQDESCLFLGCGDFFQ